MQLIQSGPRLLIQRPHDRFPFELRPLAQPAKINCSVGEHAKLFEVINKIDKVVAADNLSVDEVAHYMPHDFRSLSGRDVD